MADYRIVAKVKNNRILTLIEQAGYSTIAEFCRANGLIPSAVSALVSMREAPRGVNGWYKGTIDLATALRVQPDELFNARQLTGGNARTITREVDETELSLDHISMNDRLIAPPDEAVTAKVDVGHMLDALKPRERKVIEMLFGLGEYCGTSTLAEVAADIGVSVERARQIEMKALRRMRLPSVSGNAYQTKQTRRSLGWGLPAGMLNG